MTPGSVIGLVVSAAGGLESVHDGFVVPALARGWTVAITATPTAAVWLDGGGDRDRLERTTGLPVRDSTRMPGEVSPHPRPHVVVVAPATANTVAKLALGIADNQAMTVAAEAVGSLPTIVFPRINAAHARHPAWEPHLASLRSAEVQLVEGCHWPLHEPGVAPPDRVLPWQRILNLVSRILSTDPDTLYGPGHGGGRPIRG